MWSRSAGWVDWLSGSFLGLLEKGTGQGTFPAMSRGEAVMVMATVTIKAMGNTVSSAGPGNKAELAGEGGALHCVPFQCMVTLPQRRVLDCCTLATAAKAVGRLGEGDAQQGQSLGRR